MGTRPSASIIIIGDEVLKGQTQDTNSYFICRMFYSWGLKVKSISVIPDDVDVIAAEVGRQSKEHTFVITTGGIGPTHDDVTYEGVGKAFDKKLVLDTKLQKCLMTLSKNTKEAFIPESAKIHHTSIKCMPIVSIKNVYIFPGIPSLLEAAIMDLKDIFCASSKPFFQKNLFLNVDELNIVNILNNTSEEYKSNCQIGCYPLFDNNWYKTKLSLEAESETALNEIEAFLRSHLPPNCIVGEHSPMSDYALKMFQDICDSKKSNSSLAKCMRDSLKLLKECFKKYSFKDVCLSFNGGKDCTVLLHIVSLFILKNHPQNEPLKVLYVTSKHPFPEIEYFIQLCALRYNLKLLSYEQPIKEALGKLRNEHPEIKAVLMGSRLTDSHSSKIEPFQETDAGWPQFMRVCPILKWSYHDIWSFLRTLNIPYCSLYDKGYTSLGCLHNTLPNEKLKTQTKEGKEYYLPAYLLKVPEEERNGRSVHVP